VPLSQVNVVKVEMFESSKLGSQSSAFQPIKSSFVEDEKAEEVRCTNSENCPNGEGGGSQLVERSE
jgi:hypothetical protein